MSYAGLPPSEFAMLLCQQAQQRNQNDHQAFLNQFPNPQYAQAPSNQSASYPATPQRLPPTFSNNIASSGPFDPFPNPFPMGSHPVQCPVQLPHVPFPHDGMAAPAYGNLDNFQRPTAQHIEYSQSQTHPSDHLGRSQQVQPSQSLQPTHGPLPYRNNTSATNWTTIHPTLGLCILVPIGAMSLSAPQSPGNWTAASTAGSRHHHRDHHNSRVDRLRRRHSRELTPYVRYMSPSPSSSFSPYFLSPSSSVTVTPALRQRHLNDPDSRSRSTPRFRAIGGFTPLRSHSVPRPSIEASVSTVRTCSSCRGTGTDSSYEPFTDGSVAPTPRTGREDAVVGQGESSRGQEVETREGPVEGRRRFQASVEDVDE